MGYEKCPTCGSTDPAVRHGVKAYRNDNSAWVLRPCSDSYHAQPLPEDHER